ncbi:MAG: hypothetical protein KA712_24760 [Myxococcales bacterium]|nr:hypothetical protein [Myxococcales bacterium]
MANGSHPKDKPQSEKPNPPSFADRVRRWVDELVDGLVDLVAPEPVPVPIRRPGR